MFQMNQPKSHYINLKFEMTVELSIYIQNTPTIPLHYCQVLYKHQHIFNQSIKKKKKSGEK